VPRMAHSQNLNSLAELFPQVDKAVIALIFDENRFRMEPTIESLMMLVKDLPPSQTENPEPLKAQDENDAASDIIIREIPDTSDDEKIARNIQQQFTNHNVQQMQEDELLARQLAENSDAAFARKLQMQYDPNFGRMMSGPATTDLYSYPGMGDDQNQSNDLFPDINLKKLEDQVDQKITDLKSSITELGTDLEKGAKSAWLSFSSLFEEKPQLIIPENYQQPKTEHIEQNASFFFSSQEESGNTKASLPQTLIVSISESDSETDFSDTEKPQPLDDPTKKGAIISSH